jgi:hypothetical protein
VSDIENFVKLRLEYFERMQVAQLERRRKMLPAQQFLPEVIVTDVPATDDAARPPKMINRKKRRKAKDVHNKDN